MILHHLQQRLDRLMSEVISAASLWTERVGFVYKEDAAQGFCDHLFDLDGRLSDVARDQRRAIRLHQMPTTQNLERAINLRQQARDCRLACAGIAGKDQMSRDG